MTAQLKKVLVLEEKNGTFYYDASTSESLAKACVAILKERSEAGYWYHRMYTEAENPDADTELLAITDEELKALPAAVADDVKKKVMRAREAQNSWKRRKASEDNWFKLLDRILEAPDGEAWKIVTDHAKAMAEKYGREPKPLAEQLLSSRRDYEYEGFEIRDIEAV